MQEIHTDTEGCNRDSHEPHVHAGRDLQFRHPLEVAHDQNHDDQLDDLVIEIIERADLKERNEGLMSSLQYRSSR